MANEIDIDDLSHRLKLLPTELQEKIKDLTFFFYPEVTQISRTLKPPIGLQISQSIREHAAEHYYQTAFQITVSARDEHHKLLSDWLRGISEHHRKHIRTLRLYRPKWSPENGFGRVNSLALAEMLDLMSFLGSAGWSPPNEALYVNSRAGDGETEEWWSFPELFQGKRDRVDGAGPSAVERVTQGLRWGWAQGGEK